MPYTLIVVDMQFDFRAANNIKTVANCQREIKQAISDRAGIIFLEYYGYLSTKKELFSLVRGYDRAWSVTKFDDDGSLDASTIMIHHNFNSDKIKICGVNTDCCVKWTVSGLAALYPKANIEVIEDACGSDWSHSQGIFLLKKIPNVCVKENILNP
jgi:nicotinamidase-related amidase